MVRRLVGPRVPIVVTHDLHCNVSERMIAALDCFIAYRTNPHVDMAARAAEAADAMRELLAGEKTAKAFLRLPLTPPSVTLLTAEGPYADLVRDCLQQINAMAEAAMGRSLSGDVQGAVAQLLEDGGRTQNTKLIDLAHQIVSRNQTRLEQAGELQSQIDALRQRCGVGPARAMLGQEGERSAGGVVLRIRDREAAKAQLKTGQGALAGANRGL
eukprot:gene12509-15284_t